MIRQRVLEQWKGFKEKFLNSSQLLKEVNDVLLSASVVDVDKQTPNQVMAELKSSLPIFVQDCQQLRNKYRYRQFSNIDDPAVNTYLLHIDLVKTYQKIIEYYDSDQSGPTIEEVD